MRTQPRKNRRVLTRTKWVAVAFALVVHGAVVASVNTFGISIVGEAFSADIKGAAARDPKEAMAALATTCRGDVLLATGARAAMCLAPWNADVEGCGHDAAMSMWMDLSSCEGFDDHGASAAVALLEPKAAAKLKPIDPEPLLEQLQPEPPKDKPPEIKPQPNNQPPPPPPPPPAPTRPAQVVEVVKPKTEQAPDNARLLSEYDVSVAKQTVARGSAKEPMVAKSSPEELAAKQTPKEASMKEPDKPRGKDVRAPDAPGLLSMRAPGALAPDEQPQDAKTRGAATGERGPIVADGFIPRRGDGAIEQLRREQGELPRGQGGAGGGAPQVPSLKPSDEVLERAVGGGSVDHLDDVADGDETSLSAKRWVYATFFNRMKRQVAQNWDAVSVWRRTDPDGSIYGFKARITEVRVSLSPKGELAKIVVTTPCGIAALDDEAVRSFHAAAPFPNPPAGLVKEGLITFAFSFHVGIEQARTSWRVLRD